MSENKESKPCLCGGWLEAVEFDNEDFGYECESCGLTISAGSDHIVREEAEMLNTRQLSALLDEAVALLRICDGYNPIPVGRIKHLLSKLTKEKS